MRTTFIATGDSFITRRIPDKGYSGFEDLKTLIEKHDVRFTNLEMTFHEDEAFPAAASGGTWAVSEPAMLDDMKRYGFNLFNTANNHSGDFGQLGVLATIRHLKERNMVFAGTGATLQEASKACYLETPQARVALIGATSNLDPAAIAGGQGFRMKGRPGLNPLRYKTIYHVDQETFEMVNRMAKRLHINDYQELTIELGYAAPLPPNIACLGTYRFVLDSENFVETIPDPIDEERILDEIREAKRQADIVLFSIHTHEMVGKDFFSIPEFISTISHKAIDAGASVVIGHGPHMLRGVEAYHGGVIFHSLGNFLFQTETIASQPYDAFVKMHLSQDTRVGEYMDNRSKNGTVGYPVMPDIWNAFVPSWTMENGELQNVKLYPIELGQHLSRAQRGWPRLSESNETLEKIRLLSEKLGTKIKIENGIGTVELK